MQELAQKIKERLTLPLPGPSAHNLMLPNLKGSSRIRFRFDEAPKRGAVLILLYEKSGIIHFPLIQRPLYDGVHSGQMGLPGGKYELADGSLEVTATRETFEEIGVDPVEVELLGHLSEFMVSASNHLILPYVGFSKTSPHFVPDHKEVAEVVEAPLEQLLDSSRIREKEIVTAYGHRLHSPYFDIEDRVVWGATAMMLSEFVQVIREL